MMIKNLICLQVFTKVFEKSAHVGHYSRYKEEYEEEVHKFLKFIEITETSKKSSESDEELAQLIKHTAWTQYIVEPQFYIVFRFSSRFPDRFKDKLKSLELKSFQEFNSFKMYVFWCTWLKFV